MAALAEATLVAATSPVEGTEASLAVSTAGRALASRAFLICTTDLVMVSATDSTDATVVIATVSASDFAPAIVSALPAGAGVTRGGVGAMIRGSGIGGTTTLPTTTTTTRISTRLNSSHIPL